MLEFRDPQTGKIKTSYMIGGVAIGVGVLYLITRSGALSSGGQSSSLTDPLSQLNSGLVGLGDGGVGGGGGGGSSGGAPPVILPNPLPIPGSGNGGPPTGGGSGGGTVGDSGNGSGTSGGGTNSGGGTTSGGSGSTLPVVGGTSYIAPATAPRPSLSGYSTTGYNPVTGLTQLTSGPYAGKTVPLTDPNLNVTTSTPIAAPAPTFIGKTIPLTDTTVAKITTTAPKPVITTTAPRPTTTVTPTTVKVAAPAPVVGAQSFVGKTVPL